MTKQEKATLFGFAMEKEELSHKYFNRMNHHKKECPDDEEGHKELLESWESAFDEMFVLDTLLHKLGLWEEFLSYKIDRWAEESRATA